MFNNLSLSVRIWHYLKQSFIICRYLYNDYVTICHHLRQSVIIISMYKGFKRVSRMFKGVLWKFKWCFISFNQIFIAGAVLPSGSSAPSVLFWCFKAFLGSLKKRFKAQGSSVSETLSLLCSHFNYPSRGKEGGTFWVLSRVASQLKRGHGKVSNSNNLLFPASTCTLILDT